MTDLPFKLRATLKRVGWIYALNASFKARSTQRSYRHTLAHYRDLPSPSPAPAVPRLPPRAPTFAPNIFFVGTDEQQDRSGILQALERLGKLRYFTRADGSYGQNDPRAGEIRRAALSARLWELVESAASAGDTPHVLIAQTWASVIDPQVLARIRSAYGTLIINIAMDDRHQYRGDKTNGEWGGTFGLIPVLDLALTAAPECVDWYRKEGCAALFFPEASDPAIFHPLPELPKQHDVSFVGGCYGIRKDIVAAIRQAGINVTAFGDGWERGRIAAEEVPALFAQSKIVLGIGTIGYCRDFYALKMRDFDAPMSGSLYLTHDNPDLRTLFEIGREIVTYRDAGDCVAKVRHFLRHDAERAAIAAAGRARAARDHTWHRRFAELFGAIGG
jgi:hypothetical protein